MSSSHSRQSQPAPSRKIEQAVAYRFCSSLAQPLNQALVPARSSGHADNAGTDKFGQPFHIGHDDRNTAGPGTAPRKRTVLVPFRGYHREIQAGKRIYRFAA